MNEWLTAKQIGDAVGLHISNVIRRATKEAWISRPRQGKGGGKEYALSGLPADLQMLAAKYLANQMAKENPQFAAGKVIAEKMVQQKAAESRAQHQVLEQGAAEFGQLTGKSKSRAEARLVILASRSQYLQPWIAKGQKVKGEHSFVEEYNQHHLAFDADIYQVVPKLSWIKMRRWESTLSSDGAGALGGKYCVERPMMIDADEQLQTLCRGLVWHSPDIQATNLHEVIRAQVDLGKLDCALPSKSSVRRWLIAFNQEYELALSQLRNPDDFKNRRQVAWGNASQSVLHINQLWELDSTPSDVLLTDGRHSIVGAIDVFSRRPIVIVHPTSSAEAVCLLLRKAVLEFGVPQTVKTDNGRDYTSKRVMGVLASLGIEQVLTKPFAGDEKPHIERFFKTWAHGISMLLPGYGGHNVAARQKIRARTSFADRIMSKREEKGSDGKMRLSKGADVEVAISSKELQTIIDEWIEHQYLHKTHRMIHATPFAKWQSQRTTLRTIDNERALDVLLSPVPASSGRPAGVRVANKDAGLVVEGISYFAPELGSLIGHSLYCSWDPRDVGQLYVFEPATMAYVCTAKNADLIGHGVSLGDLSREARRQQSEQLREQRKSLRKASAKVSAGDAAMDVLAAAKLRNGNLSGLPHASEVVNTAAMQSAKQAVAAQTAPVRMDKNEFERRREEQLQLDQVLEAQRAQPRFRNQTEEFVYYLRQADVRPLTVEEISKMNQFRQQNPKMAAMAEGVKSGEKNKASR